MNPSKKPFSNFYIPSTFEEFPDEILQNIYTNLVEEYPTRDQAMCNLSDSVVNLKTRDIVSELIRKLPTLRDYQNNYIYYLEFKDSFPPYFIGCEDVCYYEEECYNLTQDITFFDTLDTTDSWNSFQEKTFGNLKSLFPNKNDYIPNEGFQKTITLGYRGRRDTSIPHRILPSIRGMSSDINFPFSLELLEPFTNLYKIIWNCECLHVQLPISINLNLYQQRLFFKKGGNWTLLEILYNVLEFYNEEISKEELNHILEILSNNIQNEIQQDEEENNFSTLEKLQQQLQQIPENTTVRRKYICFIINNEEIKLNELILRHYTIQEEEKLMFSLNYRSLPAPYLGTMFGLYSETNSRSLEEIIEEDQEQENEE